MSTWCNQDGLLVHYGRRLKNEVLECCTDATPPEVCPDPQFVRATNVYRHVHYEDFGVPVGYGPMSVETDNP